MTLRKIAGGEVADYSTYLLSTAAEEAGYRAQRGDYYLGREGEQVAQLGRWHEVGEPVLGLDGQEVERATLRAIWRNQDPVSGEALTRFGAEGNHVAAVDCTFSPPKDFSILWALADEPERALLEEAWSRSVRQSLEHIQREVPLVRRRVAGSPPLPEPAAGLLASEFVHHTSRLTAAAAQAGAGADPQLHSHVTLANVARRSDGKLAAIASYGLMVQQKEIGALARATLASELRELGYEIVPREEAWAIAGISDRKRTWFSKREAEVLDAERRWATEHGRPPNPEERRNLVVLSRGGKDVNPTGDFERWRREDAELDASAATPEERGVSVGEILAGAHARRERAQEVHGMAVDRAQVGMAAVRALTTPEVTLIGKLGPDRLTADSAVFDEIQLRKEVAREMQRHQVRAADFREVIDSVHRASELKRIDAPKDELRGHWTTTRHLDTETFVLDALGAKAEAGGHAIPQEYVEGAIASSPFALSPEQEAAVRACTDHRALRLVAAEAGTGKSTGVGRTVADAYRRAGYRIVATSTAGRAAVKFGQDIGADEACSIDSLTNTLAKAGTAGYMSRRAAQPDRVYLDVPFEERDLARSRGAWWDRAEQSWYVPASEASGWAGLRFARWIPDPEYVPEQKTLILLDEAGQVDTVSRWDELLRHVGDAKLIPIGDERQLSAVTPGGIFETAQETVPTSRLTEVFRNRDPEVVAIWRQIRAGDGVAAAHALAARGMLDFAEDRLQLRERMIESWDEVRRNLGPGKTLEDCALLTDTSNREVDWINRMIQERRIAAGELSGKPVAVRYEDPGDRSYVREEALHAGDIVKTTRTVWLSEAKEKVRNGEIGHVVATRGDGSAALVKFGDRALWIGEGGIGATEHPRDALRLAYMTHQQGGQGLTCDGIGGLLGGRSTTLEGGYVQASRTRQHALLLADYDTLGIPERKVIREATDTDAGLVHIFTAEQRRALALEAIGERLATSGAKETATSALAREARLVQESAAMAEREGQGELVTTAEPPPGSASRAWTHVTASEKQRAYADGLGVDLPREASWVEASMALDRASGASEGALVGEWLAARGMAPEDVEFELALARDRMAAWADAEGISLAEFEPETETAPSAEPAVEPGASLAVDAEPLGDGMAELDAKVDADLWDVARLDEALERYREADGLDMESARSDLEWSLGMLEGTRWQDAVDGARAGLVERDAAERAQAEAELLAPHLEAMTVEERAGLGYESVLEDDDDVYGRALDEARDALEKEWVFNEAGAPTLVDPGEVAGHDAGERQEEEPGLDRRAEPAEPDVEPAETTVTREPEFDDNPEWLGARMVGSGSEENEMAESRRDVEAGESVQDMFDEWARADAEDDVIREEAERKAREAELQAELEEEECAERWRAQARDVSAADHEQKAEQEREFDDDPTAQYVREGAECEKELGEMAEEDEAPSLNQPWGYGVEQTAEVDRGLEL